LFLCFVSEDCSSVHGKGLTLSVEEEAVAGRIFSLHWLSSDSLLSCGPNGILEMWKLGESSQVNWLSQCVGYDSNFAFRACVFEVFLSFPLSIRAVRILP
jgi:hypothetical protein